MFVHGGGQHWWEKLLWQFTVAIKSDPVAPPKTAPISASLADSVIVDFICPGCKHKQILQANFKHGLPMAMGASLFPKSNVIKCRSCGKDTNLGILRQKIEKDAGRVLVF